MGPLSKRSTWSSEPWPEYLQRAFGARSDLYSDSNTAGYISLAVAENIISAPLVASALSRIPPIPVENLTYSPSLAADPPCAAVMAKFMSRHITKRPVDADHLIFTCGAASALDMLSFTLCNPGDAVMIVGPGYRGFKSDAMWRSGVRLVVAPLSLSNSLGVTSDCLESAWQNAGGDGSKIRYVIVCSPGNPTGEVLLPSTIRDIVAWARRRNLHAVFDELYALSTYGDTKFYSVAEVLDNELGDDVHIVWSLSKDFCASGLRFGVLLSHSKELRTCVTRISLFSDISRMAQWAVQNLLADDAFISSFVPENKKRLGDVYNQLTRCLETDHVPYIPAQAGFFVWICLKKWMRGEPSRESEMELWRRLLDAKVILSPGCECFSPSYGWFRVCFAAAPAEVIMIAWKRIRDNVLKVSTIEA